MTRPLSWWLLGCALVAPLSPACSLQNKEGPDVSCADLACGRVNACRDGIIAQCLDRETVRFVVCHSGAPDICDEEWQIPGQYRCVEHATDCEGCRPERSEGCASFAGQGGEGGQGGGS